MRFYFNGCSYTMGSGVQESIWTVEEKTKIWPYLVVKEKNLVEIYNKLISLPLEEKRRI